MNSLPRRNSLGLSNTSPTSGHAGAVKRKWSPGRSDSSTVTLTSQHESLRETGPVSFQECDSPRGNKRAKVDECLPAPNPTAGAVRRIPSDRSHLPGEMWQFVFTYLPPSSLGCLMSVNKVFHTLLAPKSVLPGPRLATNRPLGLTDQEHIWSLSRRAFFPGMPRPPSSRSEMETWKLIRAKSCEFCTKTNISTLPPVSTSPWAAGPGNEYVRVIWPFGVRSCGKCLRGRLRKVGFGRTYYIV